MHILFEEPLLNPLQPFKLVSPQFVYLAVESWATGEVCLQFSYRMSTCFLTHPISSILKFFHCSTTLPILRLIRLFGFCQSGGRVMVSHEVECFHMFVDHLSVQGFGLVFYCVICLLLVILFFFLVTRTFLIVCVFLFSKSPIRISQVAHPM